MEMTKSVSEDDTVGNRKVNRIGKSKVDRIGNRIEEELRTTKVGEEWRTNNVKYPIQRNNRKTVFKGKSLLYCFFIRAIRVS